MKFFYKAKKKSAETVTGSILAQDKFEAVELIHQLGLVPVEVAPEKEEPKFEDFTTHKKVRFKNRYFFTHQLANLMKSGISLVKALSLLRQQIQNAYFKSVVARIEEDVKNGNAFSRALARFPHVFSDMYVAMVHAGEESGRVYASLRNLSQHQKKQRDLQAKVRTALAYPLFMAVVGTATVYYMIVFVFPKMMALFEDLQTIPLPTRIMIRISGVLSQQWEWILGLLAVVVFAFRMFHVSRAGRSLLSRALFKIPFFNDLIVKAELARFANAIVMLSETGIPLTRSLDIAIPVLSNEVMKDQFYSAKETLLAGGSLGEHLQKSRVFPSLLGHLVAVGEESDSLEDVFREIAESYTQETEEKMKVMTTLFEPLMILIIGLMIGFMVFAMLLPIFQMDTLMN
jgi:type II secretory pathway component PulF